MDAIQMERLRWVASANPGDIAPDHLFTVNNWSTELREAIKASLDEAERLRNILRRCQRGVDPVDIGGEVIGLHLRREE